MCESTSGCDRRGQYQRPKITEDGNPNPSFFALSAWKHLGNKSNKRRGFEESAAKSNDFVPAAAGTRFGRSGPQSAFNCQEQENNPEAVWFVCSLGERHTHSAAEIRRSDSLHSYALPKQKVRDVTR